MPGHYTPNRGGWNSSWTQRQMFGGNETTCTLCKVDLPPAEGLRVRVEVDIAGVKAGTIFELRHDIENYPLYVPAPHEDNSGNWTLHRGPGLFEEFIRANPSWFKRIKSKK